MNVSATHLPCTDDPDFARSMQVYIYYHTGNNFLQFQAVARFDTISA